MGLAADRAGVGGCGVAFALLRHRRQQCCLALFARSEIRPVYVVGLQNRSVKNSSKEQGKD